MSEQPLCPNPEPHSAHVWFEGDDYRTCIGRDSSLTEDLADLIEDVLDQHGEETDFDGSRIWGLCYCGAKVEGMDAHVAYRVAQAVLDYFRRRALPPVGERPPGQQV